MSDVRGFSEPTGVPVSRRAFLGAAAATGLSLSVRRQVHAAPLAIEPPVSAELLDARLSDDWETVAISLRVHNGTDATVHDVRVEVRFMDDAGEVVRMSPRVLCGFLAPHCDRTYELEEQLPEAAAFVDVACVGCEEGLSAETVEFGRYPQSGQGDGGAGPIERRVIAEDGSRRLLLAERALDCRPYNEEQKCVTWETCTLRSWLNSEFLETAFSEEELSHIVEVELENADNAFCADTPGGDPTYDRVFLLSLDEIERYFGIKPIDVVSNEFMDADWELDTDASSAYYACLVCYPTDYAVARGAYVWDEPDYPRCTHGCPWWLRSPGQDSDCAAYVYPDGYFNTYGLYVDFDNLAVRPALWVSNL